MTVSNVAVVGSGTAGLINALIVKSLLPQLNISVVSSKKVGIIGVGEGSTEHWTTFENIAKINRSEMVRKTEATFKFGLRFKNWTTHTPDYFHSISGAGTWQSGTSYAYYTWCAANDRQLTPTFSHPGLPFNLVVDSDEILKQSNQFHFDTFLLNTYLKNLCSDKGVKFVEAEVVGVTRNSLTGDVDSLIFSDARILQTDFVIDASGFQKVVLSHLNHVDWCSFKDILPTDSAVVFQTPEDIQNGIKPYTLATALSAGWLWEIPTQTRRGNGYVFASNYISDDEAIEEASFVSGFDVPTDSRIIRFEPGYVRNSWQHNCVAVGLASNFVEPLEATSIAASINQAILLTSFMPGYIPNATILRDKYLAIFDTMMENLVSMVALHYVSDREDTDMWMEQKYRQLPDLLTDLLEIMKYRGLEEHDLTHTGYELFNAPHFWHVALGQGVVSKSACTRDLGLRQLESFCTKNVSQIVQGSKNVSFIPHKEAILKGIS